MKYLFHLIILQILNIALNINSQILPKFIPNGIRKFSNGSNFTSLLIIDNFLYVGAKYTILIYLFLIL